MDKRHQKGSGMIRIKREDGFTIIEVIFAMTILVVGLLAVATMQVTAIRGNSTSMDVSSAIDLVQDRVDKLLSVNIGHADLSPGNHPDPVPDDKFEITWSVQNNTPIFNVKTINVTVEWNDRGLTKQHSFEFMRTEL
ncbi:prepilin-type N-terminal cleavage/methylation domain-containing protein [Thermodesulfobacteriota bacterium]